MRRFAQEVCRQHTHVRDPEPNVVVFEAKRRLEELAGLKAARDFNAASQLDAKHVSHRRVPGELINCSTFLGFCELATADFPTAASHPFLHALESAAARAWIRRLRRSSVRRHDGPTRSAARDPFSAVVDRLFRGHRFGARHCVARGGLVRVARLLDVGLEAAPPDLSTISRTRRLIDLETHRAVFTWVLQCLSTAGLVKGKTVGIDATTLEANAALRSIVRRDSGES